MGKAAGARTGKQAVWTPIVAPIGTLAAQKRSVNDSYRRMLHKHLLPLSLKEKPSSGASNESGGRLPGQALRTLSTHDGYAVVCQRQADRGAHIQRQIHQGRHHKNGAQGAGKGVFHDAAQLGAAADPCGQARRYGRANHPGLRAHGDLDRAGGQRGG